MIVTIDGPAGSGKSSVAKNLASQLQFRFLNTGAMYRAVAWACLKKNLPLSVSDAAPNETITSEVLKTTEELNLELQGDTLLVDGCDQTDELQREDVSSIASVVAALPGVRTLLVSKQRHVAENGNFVTEGRDQGTIVFPDAECKFFLTASAEVRAQRRFVQLQNQEFLQNQEPVTTFDVVLKGIQHRDARDENRTTAPLRAASDAQIIDTSSMTPDEVLQQLEFHVRKKMSSM